MASTLVVVDGHNFFNDAGRALVEEGRHLDLLGAYFRDWFDADRLIAATLSDHPEVQPQPSVDLGTVIFHSRKSLGGLSAPYKVADGLAFWARQASMPNTSTILFEIEGAPSGKAKPKDDETGSKVTGRDFGMDVAIAVHLLETAPRWDAAVLFTGDTDLVAAVWSLRRLGKRIFCALPARAESSPLVRACQSFFAWNLDFLRADLSLFALLQKDGALDRFRRHELARAWEKPVFQDDAIWIPKVGRPSENILNELLTQDGLFFYGDWGGTSAVAVRPAKRIGGREGIRYPEIVMNGVSRHGEIFKDAHWQST